MPGPATADIIMLVHHTSHWLIVGFVSHPVDTRCICSDMSPQSSCRLELERVSWALAVLVSLRTTISTLLHSSSFPNAQTKRFAPHPRTELVNPGCAAETNIRSDSTPINPSRLSAHPEPFVLTKEVVVNPYYQRELRVS